MEFCGPGGGFSKKRGGGGGGFRGGFWWLFFVIGARSGLARLGWRRPTPQVSISSANPSQYITPPSNYKERLAISNGMTGNVGRLAQRRAFIHSYASRAFYQLKFSGIASDIFSVIRERVDGSIGTIVPNAAQKFTAVYENLTSDNPEDWSNAVHSCRRILQDLADVLYPAGPDRVIEVSGVEKTIRMGSENYINRLIAAIESGSGSTTFDQVVGSNLSFIGDRLDSVFRAGQKGSHATISSKAEAERYVVYTYMLVGDLLTLIKSPAVSPTLVAAEPLEPGATVGPAPNNEQ